MIGAAKRVGVEFDHLTLATKAELEAALDGAELIDISPAVMQQRMMKSPEEIALIKAGAETADIGGYAILDAIKEA